MVKLAQLNTPELQRIMKIHNIDEAQCVSGDNYSKQQCAYELCMAAGKKNTKRPVRPTQENEM